ncbi:peptidase M13 [Schaalia sp. 19OD2882]|uniref:M13 family metallopeptidase n=1 Tax=Schaalia sp. 19OD2882 TaxID=2794089 RepID=UPI001C1EF3F4|nr:M13-type metalloendopeptidase [Schaalia sp. 19OD2882]QWW18853.1 peptidase M13 [Schaalia sp. 19OD2882]
MSEPTPDTTVPCSDVRPQDDWFRHVNGQWLATHEIPADRPIDGAFHALRDSSEERSKAICEEAAAGTISGHGPALIATMWSRFMDEEAVAAAGAAPLDAERQVLAEATTREDLAVALGRLQRWGSAGLVGVWVGSDPHDPDVTMLTFTQSGIGLPDEAYYRDPTHAEVLDAYRNYLTQLLTLLGGEMAATAATTAAAVVDLEKAIASHHRDAVANRDPLAHDNPMRWADLPTLAPGFDWEGWAKGLGLDTHIDADTVINVHQPDFLTGIAALWAASDPDLLRVWMLTDVVDSRAPLLSPDFVDTHFAFHGTVMAGTTEKRARWKRALSLVEATLGEELGLLWVQRHFPPSSKQLMDALVEALLRAYDDSIRALDWMGEATKAKALDKLASFTPKIGYPTTVPDRSDLELGEDLVAGVRMCAAHERDRDFAKLAHPVDRTEWFMTPQTVNAYYNPTMNEIVFPAAILQPPFFDPEAPDAANFGAIGAVIGHEIGHGFDDQGSRYDGHGALVDWWQEEDRQRFEERTAALVAQYDVLIPADLRTGSADDPHVNGALTVGENIGDLGGLSIAWKACLDVLGARGQEVDEQVARTFFTAWAHAWRSKSRPEFARQMLAVDPHSPAEFRCNQVVANMDAFAEAFDVHEGDGLWIAPEERVRIW